MSSEVQDNVVKQYWIQDADMWEQLPSTLSSPGDVGQEHLFGSDGFPFSNHQQWKLSSPSQESESSNLSVEMVDAFHLMANSFTGKDLLSRLTSSVSYDPDPDVDDIISSMCTQLLKFEVLESVMSSKDNTSTPEHDRPSITAPKFQPTEKYRWASKSLTTHPEGGEKTRKLRQHNKDLKSRLNKLHKEIVRLESQAKEESNRSMRPCQIEVHSEGKTNTSVSMPSTILSISTFNEGSGSHVSLSFTEPECRFPGYSSQSIGKNSLPSDSSTPVSCDSYQTATESPKETDKFEDASEEPVIIHRSSSHDPIANQSDALNQQKKTINSMRQFSQCPSNESVSKDSDSSTLTGSNAVLCSRCKQSIMQVNRLSNASIDSGLSQSSSSFPTCSVTGSDISLSASPPIRNLMLSQSTPAFNTQYEDNCITSTFDSYTNPNADVIPSTNRKLEDKTSANHKLFHIAEDTALTNDKRAIPTASAPPPPVPPIFPNNTMPRRKAVIKPRVSLRPLHWRRIQLQTKTSQNNFKQINTDKPSTSSIWEKLQEPKLDSNELDELFSLDENDAKERLSTMTSSMLTLGRRNFTKVLNRKRSQNLGIILSGIRQPFSEVKKALLNFDVTFLPIDTWQALHDAGATEKELMEIQEHMESNPKCVLDKPEQFLYNLNSMSFGAERIRCFLLRSHFEEVTRDIDSQLNSMVDICYYMINSVQIENLLSLLLAIGNYLNGGNNSRGQADGFSLDILPKLKDIKGKKQMSLLRYMANKYKSLYGKVGEKRRYDLPLPLLNGLINASNINYKEMSKATNSLQLELSDCSSLMDKVRSTLNEQSSNQIFYNEMSSFLSQSNVSMDAIHIRIEESKANFAEMVQFYSAPYADSRNVTPTQFFEPWILFSKDLAEVWEPSNHQPFSGRASASF